ncbi:MULTISPECIES: ABC transporter ATP-binding protein [Thiorhodovibrio]|uniref:ABC transporter ATP-binding protein n=1 Tax=Thiorhodovibrio TaxID=61593 RepID=UPI001913F462|nr:ABC transporter ATP-binding protein [Thiorhodovibrio litoralis]MBK5967721.1 ABC transporter ATP-binding protein [Thiorhodovibrio winogradskyi]WPL11668.1 putative ABC transporter ATP-binding protein YbhF [Thiorhodovibrio litoralis]
MKSSANSRSATGAASAPDSDVAVEAHGLTRRFGDLLAVDALDLQVAPRSIYGFLGPNGCGKTTTVRMLTGLLTPTSGEVTVLGHRLPGEAEILKRKIGYMTQKFSLYEDLTVLENLRFVASVYGLGPREAKSRIAELLDNYALEPLAWQRAGSMSGGQRQRLSLAAAILHRPSLLFLDEPTSAVDPENRRDFWERLFDLIDAGATILVSTHYMDEAERCHRLAILEAGHKRADGSPAELMAAMGAHVLELEGPNLRQTKTALTALPEILSAAQLGSRLRVLVRDQVAEPKTWLRALPVARDLTNITPARPSLEDVFVTCTGHGRPEQNQDQDQSQKQQQKREQDQEQDQRPEQVRVAG